MTDGEKKYKTIVLVAIFCMLHVILGALEFNIPFHSRWLFLKQLDCCILIDLLAQERRGSTARPQGTEMAR